MNWFRKHLNWTTIIIGSIYFIFSILTYAFNFSKLYAKVFVDQMGTLFSVVPNWILFNLMLLMIPDYGTGYRVPHLSNIFLPAAIIFAGLIWVLKQKKRSLWWLLFIIIIPFGWLIIMFLSSKKQSVVQENMQLPATSTIVKEQDEIKNNKSYSDTIIVETKMCPFCHSNVPSEASWCPNCSSAL